MIERLYKNIKKKKAKKSRNHSKEVSKSCDCDIELISVVIIYLDMLNLGRWKIMIVTDK